MCTDRTFRAKRSLARLCTVALAFGTPMVFAIPEFGAWAAPAVRRNETGLDAREPSVNVATSVLPNGLRVFLHEDHKSPLVAVNIHYRVGSKDEPAGRNGFAHLFEHMMFQGSKHVAEDTFFKILQRAGMTDANGTTNTDRTNYYETLPSSQLELALWLESDRMGFLLDQVTEVSFAGQRDVVKNERRQSYENRPYGFISEFFIRTELYPVAHPYHFSTIGSPEDLDRAQLDDVKAFFRTFYVPNNASLSISGDFNSAQALALVEKYFAPIPKGVEPPRRSVPDVKVAAETVLRVESSAELARLSITWPTPAVYASGDGELDILAHVLSSGKTSRLYKRLVYDAQIAQAVSAGQASAQLGSRFEIGVTLKPGHTTYEALAIVDEELARLATADDATLTPEVSRGKTEIAASAWFALESASALAEAANAYSDAAGDPNYFAKDQARYRAVTNDAVRSALATYLPRGHRIVTHVVYNERAPLAGRLISTTRGNSPPVPSVTPMVPADRGAHK